MRKELKGATGRRRARLVVEVQDILRQGILREWNLMIEARRAFLALGLSTAGLADLVKDSKDRLEYALANGHFPARRPDMLTKWLEQMEAGAAKAEFAALQSDPVVRDEAQRVGAVVGDCKRRRQPKRGFHPCEIDVDLAQGTVRLRSDDKVVVAGSRVTGIVRDFSQSLSVVLGSRSRSRQASSKLAFSASVRAWTSSGNRTVS